VRGAARSPATASAASFANRSLHQHEIPAVDLVVSVRPVRVTPTGQALRESLAALWKKVGEQCATSQPS